MSWRHSLNLACPVSLAPVRQSVGYTLTGRDVGHGLHHPSRRRSSIWGKGQSKGIIQGSRHAASGSVSLVQRFVVGHVLFGVFPVSMLGSMRASRARACPISRNGVWRMRGLWSCFPPSLVLVLNLTQPRLDLSRVSGNYLWSIHFAHLRITSPHVAPRPQERLAQP